MWIPSHKLVIAPAKPLQPPPPDAPTTNYPPINTSSLRTASHIKTYHEQLQLLGRKLSNLGAGKLTTSQKAIAIVQKAIEEDVKQNYTVRCPTGPNRLTSRKRTSSIKMPSITSCW